MQESKHRAALLSSFLAIAYKEFLHIKRDRAALKLLFVLQLLNMLFAGAIDFRGRGLPVAIVDQDRTTASRELIAQISATKSLRVDSIIGSPEEARELVRSGIAHAAVVIPPDYHEKRIRGGATILAMVDGSDSSVSRQALGALGGLSARINLDVQRSSIQRGSPAPGLAVTSLILFNPQGRTTYFLLPGLVVVQVQQLLMLTLRAFARERGAGTLERLQMTPLSPTALLLGKMTPYWLIALVDLVLLYTVMRAFGVPVRGDPLLLLFAGALFMLTAIAFGIFVTATSTPGSAQQKIWLYTRSTIFLSGYIFPLASLPKALLFLAYAHPATHMIAVSRSIVLRDTPFLDLLPHFAYLLVAPAVLIVAGMPRFRRSLMPAS